MTKALKTIDLNLLPLETLAEMANEKAEQVERNAKKTVADAMDCGRFLEAAKEQVEPGKWLEWLGKNWNYSRQTATTYMRLADHGKRFPSVEYQSVREAMKMIVDEKAEADPDAIVPRSERKSGQVEVVDSAKESDHIADASKMVDAGTDDDPTPDPPTNRKTAKGSEKVSEDKKPRTQNVVPEILDDEPVEDPISDWFKVATIDEIVTQLIERTENRFDQKKTAKALRKWADKLDPPTKFVKPDLDDVTAYFAELKAVDAESFFDFYESKGWLVGKVSMKNWQASARKWVRENQSNGKVNGNGSATRNGGNRGLTADDVFSAESMGRSR